MGKAQLTMFIILGIVIISIFGFVFFTTGRVATQQAEQQAAQIVSQILETTSLKFYVTRCTEKALHDGIDILSRQGGKIFPSQKSSLLETPEKIFLQHDDQSNKTYFVGYGILYDGTPLPQYPCKIGFKNFDIPPAFCEYRSVPEFDNLDIGLPNLPRLCKNQFGGCSLREGWNPKFSVQAELERYVSDYVMDCVDFESIVGINQSYVINEGNASTNITFSDTDVTALISFPIIISPPASQPIFRIVEFTISVPSRFKQLYGIARDSVLSDTSSKTAASFDIVQNFPDILSQRYGNKETGFVAEKRTDVSFYDNLIRFIDLASPPGTSLVIQMLTENRPPVLEYIEPPHPKGKDLPAGCGVYDVIQVQNQLLRIEPRAYDPDGDTISINYSGWLEDYNETVRATVDPTTKCPVIQQPTDKKNYNKDQQGNVLESEKRWIKDVNFNNNGIASAFVTEGDIGPHQIKVSVCDKQYCDYQIIRVLIDDLIKIFVDKINPYGNNIFSLEDPYSLKASVQDIYNAVDYSFSWTIQDPSGNAIYTAQDGNQTLNLPLGSYDITSINNAYKINGVQVFQKNIQYKILANVIQGGLYKVQNDTDIVARACVPLRNAVPKPPFPYNKTDPYLSDHACCYIIGTDQSSIGINTTSDTCYAQDTYGSYNSFITNKYQTSYDQQKGNSLPAPSGINVPQIKSDIDSFKTVTDSSNDIFKRSFSRKCDGTRGNICSGMMAEAYSVYVYCSDINSGEIARCSGPPVSPNNYLSPNSESTSKISCTKYDKTTFENLTIHSDIKCNSQPKCVANNNDPNGFANSGTRYLCDATCSSQYGCSQTLPGLCQDCYQAQSCSRTQNNPQSQPEIVQTTAFKKFNGCNQNSVSCDVTQSQSQDDYCVGNILHEFTCNSQPYSTNLPYTDTATDCSSYNERAATDSDSGTNFAVEGTCHYYDRSQNVCNTGMCKYDTTGINVADGTVANADQNAQQNKYLYREWYNANGNPAGNINIKESCLFQDVDYDSLASISGSVNIAQNLCENANFGGAQGKWEPSTNTCCGDDITDICS